MSFFYIGDNATVQEVEHDDEVVVLVAGGELDYDAAPQLREHLADHVSAGIRRVVVDLSQVTFIDSTAIGALVGAAMSLQERGGGSLAVVCEEENRRVMRIFEIAGIESLIPVHRTREEAVSALTMSG
jgi:anti-sigma B factor antagonist